MKIAIYSINHYPELIGIGKYNGEMVRWLVEAGHQVRMVTAPPYYPHWKIQDGYSGWRYKREQIDGADVIRCPLWVPSRPSGLKRVVHLSVFAFFAFPVMIWTAIFWRPDVVFVVEPPITCVPGALFSALLCRAKTWLHIQDFEVDAAFDLGILKSPNLRRLIIWLEIFFMRRFDKVSTISVKMQEKLLEKGVVPDKTLLFENWVDIETIHPIQKPSSLVSAFGVPLGRRVVLYSGNMGEKQGLEIVIQAAINLAAREDVYFVLCGDGTSKRRLQAMAEGLDNVGFFPLQPLDKLNELLNLADVHLLPQQPDVVDLVMPSKLTNMMASGKPVVATVAPDTQVARVLEGCGKIVEPGNLQAFCTAIEQLLDQPECAEKMGMQARQYVERTWNMDIILKQVFGV